MIHLHITPDNRIENKDIDSILKTVSGMYVAPLHRWNGNGFDELDRTAWEIILSAESADFYLTAPNHWQSVINKQLSVIWPRATAKECEDPLSFNPITIGKLELKNHYMFSIKADNRTLGVLPSLLEVKKMLGANDKIAIQMLLEPAAPEWWQDAASAYESFTDGKMPLRTSMNAKAIGIAGAKTLTWITAETINLVTEFMTGEEQKPTNINGIDKAAALREKPIGRNMADKLKGDALDVTIRIAVDSDSEITAKSLLRSVWYSFRTLDGDNGFKLVPVNHNAWKKMIARKPGFKINNDYLSLKEASMLTHLPTEQLQKEYNIESIDYRESNIPQSLTTGGLLFGDITYHGTKSPVYLPIADLDELCLPRIVIGSMGCGKTCGFGANLAYEAVKNGMAAVVIDPAKGQIGDELEKVGANNFW
jgi:hypothetical protein